MMLVPLLSRPKVDLLVWWRYAEIPRADAERFAGQFREVWKALPPGDRRAILRHWRGWRRRSDGALGKPANAPSVSVPFVCLCDAGSEFEGRGRQRVQACVSHFGIAVLFCAPRLPKRSPAVKKIIAHELGHVRLDAAGCGAPFPVRPGPWARDDYLFSPVEAVANALAQAWGFESPEWPAAGMVALRDHADHPAARWLRRRLGVQGRG